MTTAPCSLARARALRKDSSPCRHCQTSCTLGIPGCASTAVMVLPSAISEHIRSHSSGVLSVGLPVPLPFGTVMRLGLLVTAQADLLPFLDLRLRLALRKARSF